MHLDQHLVRDAIVDEVHRGIGLRDAIHPDWLPWLGGPSITTLCSSGIWRWLR